MPSVVIEIIAGVIVGPSVLGWVHIDLPVQILAVFGLAFLLFLAGLEIDLKGLRGNLLHMAVVGYLVTLVLGIAVGAGFAALHWGDISAAGGDHAVGNVAGADRSSPQRREVAAAIDLPGRATT